MGAWGALAGAGLGAGKYYEDKQQANRDRQTQATVARYSPWTGMKPEAVHDPSLMGSTMQGATAGLGMGMNMNAASGQEAAQAQQGQLVDAQTDYMQNLNRGQIMNSYAQAQPPAGSAGSFGSNGWIQPYGPAKP